MSCDPPAGLIQSLPVHVRVVQLQVVSTEITPTNHVSQFKGPIELNEAMTAHLDAEQQVDSQTRILNAVKRPFLNSQ